MANIRDVAKDTGFSIATVSKVINNKPGVSSETRKKVLDAAKRLNYQPNIHARRLFSNKSNLIGVVFVSNLSYTVYSLIFQGINCKAHRMGYGVMTMDEDCFIAQGMEYNFINNTQVDGLIVLGKGISDDLLKVVQKSKVPVIFCPEKIESSDYAIVSPDNFNIGKMATNYLIDAGHKRIGFVGSRQEYWFSYQRCQGYLSALYDKGLDVDMNLIIHGYESVWDGGYKAGWNLLNKGIDLPTALFAVNDLMAGGVMKALKEGGIKVPDDISIIGCDDLDLVQYFDPPLTTIYIPWDKIGSIAATILIKFINEGQIEQLLHLNSGKLVERVSVKKLS